MKLGFTIDALSAAGDAAWRLQKDGSFRPCTFAEDYQPNDALIENIAEVRDWAGRRLKKDRDKVLRKYEKPGMFDFLMRGIFAHAVVHRFSSASIPDKQQFVDLVRASSPGTPWLIHLDLAGHFRAIDTSRTSIMGNPAIAVRAEIASSEEFTGPIAASNDKMMEEIYRQFLEGWYEHLKSRKTGVFVPDAEKLREKANLIADIERWQHE